MVTWLDRIEPGTNCYSSELLPHPFAPLPAVPQFLIEEDRALGRGLGLVKTNGSWDVSPWSEREPTYARGME